MSISALKIAAISCLAVGAGLGTFSAFIPGYYKDKLEKTSKTESALTNVNQAKWDSVPGQYDYNVQWDHYLFSNANYVKVSVFNAS